MQLKSEEINKYIRALKERKKLFTDDKMAIYIGKKCIRVMQRVANEYATQSTWAGKLPDGYIDAFDYEISYIEGSGKINIMLTNNCKNTDGEFISSFIENGTGVYAIDGNGRVGGWWYPSRETDLNPMMSNDPEQAFGGTKKQLPNGDYIGFTYGQVPKPILHDSLEIILAQLDSWIYEYYARYRR